MENQLTELIALAKDKNVKSLETLIIKFRPLLSSLAKRGYTEYIETDLVIDFIKLIYNIDIIKFTKLSNEAQLKYIKTSMKHSLYKNNTKVPFTELALEEFLLPTISDNHEKIEFLDFLKHLTIKKVITNKQKEVIFLKYMYEESDGKIAARYSISNQAISKIHLKALQNLRNYLN